MQISQQIGKGNYTTMKWEYIKRYLDIPIPGYVKEYLLKFNRKTTKKLQNQPYPASERTYGADAQKIKAINTPP